MKNFINTIILLSAVFMVACNNDDPQPQDPGNTYRPHLFDEFASEGFYVYDISDIHNPKIYHYVYNAAINKFEYFETEDTSTYGTIGKRLKNWPDELRDPVTVLDWNNFSNSGVREIAERSRGIDTGYYLTSSSAYEEFAPFYFPYCGIEYYLAHYAGYDGGVFGKTNYPDKIDASVVTYSTHEYNPSYNFWDTYCFNFDNGTFYSVHEGGMAPEEVYLQSDYIDKMVIKPNGNMTVSPVDFKLADAAFALSLDTVHTNIYFLDYDAEKYLQVQRLIRPLGIINSDSARFSLITTSWQPLSNLITGWKF